MYLEKEEEQTKKRRTRRAAHSRHSERKIEGMSGVEESKSTLHFTHIIVIFSLSLFPAHPHTHEKQSKLNRKKTTQMYSLSLFLSLWASSTHKSIHIYVCIERDKVIYLFWYVCFFLFVRSFVRLFICFVGCDRTIFLTRHCRFGFHTLRTHVAHTKNIYIMRV